MIGRRRIGETIAESFESGRAGIDFRSGGGPAQPRGTPAPGAPIARSVQRRITETYLLALAAGPADDGTPGRST